MTGAINEGESEKLRNILARLLEENCGIINALINIAAISQQKGNQKSIRAAKEANKNYISLLALKMTRNTNSWKKYFICASEIRFESVLISRSQ